MPVRHENDRRVLLILVVLLGLHPLSTFKLVFAVSASAAAAVGARSRELHASRV